MSIHAFGPFRALPRAGSDLPLAQLSYSGRGPFDVDGLAYTTARYGAFDLMIVRAGMPDSLIIRLDDERFWEGDASELRRDLRHVHTKDGRYLRSFSGRADVGFIVRAARAFVVSFPFENENTPTGEAHAILVNEPGEATFYDETGTCYLRLPDDTPLYRVQTRLAGAWRRRERL